MEFKPKFNAFFYPKVLAVILFYIILAISFSIVGFHFLSVALLFLVLLYVYNLNVKFENTFYYIKEGKLIYKTADLFSNKEIDINIKNITQVISTYPFIENKIFGTGHVYIKAAGTSNSAIEFSNLVETKKIYESIEEVMKKKGFSLKKDTLLQREKPNDLAVLIETLKNFSIGIFVLLVVFSQALGFLDINFYLILFFIIGAFLMVVYAVLNFLDLKHKEYFLYKDTATYYDGFLTKSYSFIPLENISDSELYQTFLDKIFDLYNLVISCQGGSNKIYFSNIKKGKLFEKNLRSLLNSKKQAKSKKAKKTSKTSLYKMNFARQITSSFVYGGIIFILGIIGSVIFFPLFLLFLPFIVFFVILISFIFKLVEYYATSYHILEEEISYNYNFLTSTSIDFSNNKITGIEKTRDVIDLFFKTYSLKIYSIGSKKEITFKYLKDEVVLREILKKFNLKHDLITEKKPFFSFIGFLQSLPLLGPVLLLAFLVSLLFYNNYLLLAYLVIFGVSLVVYFYTIHYYNHSNIEFRKNYVKCKKGYFIEKTYYALYENVKDIISKKYYLSDKGTLTVNVAGEVLVESGNNSSVPISNGFNLKYLDDALKLHDSFDKRLGLKNNKVLKRFKPELKNSILKVSLINIVLLPLVFLLPVTIITFFIYIRRYNFFIEEDRLVVERGVLLKRKTTILYDRIDHLNTTKGIFNRWFGNENILVYTAGSSSYELRFFDVLDKASKEAYKLIEKKYK